MFSQAETRIQKFKLQTSPKLYTKDLEYTEKKQSSPSRLESTSPAADHERDGEEAALGAANPVTGRRKAALGAGGRPPGEQTCAGHGREQSAGGGRGGRLRAGRMPSPWPRWPSPAARAAVVVFGVPGGGAAVPGSCAPARSQSGDDLAGSLPARARGASEQCRHRGGGRVRFRVARTVSCGTR